MRKGLLHQLNMTRRLIGLSMLFTLLFLPIGAWAQNFSGGDGSVDNPYVIRTPEELKAFSDGVNDGTLSDKSFQFPNEEGFVTIDCSNLSEFAPIGNADHPFTGTFQGNSVGIDYLTVVTPAEDGYYGLFGVIDGGSVQGLGLSNCTFTGGNRAGGVVGYLINGEIGFCTISNCTVKTSEDLPSVSAGGIAGYVENGTINKCTVMGGSVSGISTSDDSGISNVGGIVGLAGDVSGTGSITISSCEVSGVSLVSKLTVAERFYMGGIVGWCRSGNITLSGNKVSHSGTIYTTVSAEDVESGYGLFYCGAVIGESDGATLELSNNTYEYGVTVSTKLPNSEAVVKKDYEQRGRGDKIDDDATGGTLDAPDVTEDNGIVLYTKQLNVGDIAYECESYEPLIGDGVSAIAPGQTVDISLYPTSTIESVSLVYTPRGGTEQTVPLNNVSQMDDHYEYKFEMPDADATLSYTMVQGYDLWVGGVQVTSANAQNIIGDNIKAVTEGNPYSVSYNETTNTLSLVNAKIESDGITCEGDLNVSVTNSTIIRGITCGGDLDISSIGTNSIYYPVTSSSKTGATLTLQHGDDEAATLTLMYQGESSGFTSVVYDGMYLSAENRRDVKFSSTRKRFEESEWAWASTVYLSSTKTYELWIGNTKVTEANRNNILGSDENVTASFNPEGNILTLNGMTLIGTGVEDDGIISRLSNLTISINGDNTIICNDSCTAIRADMEGAQTLTIVKGSDNCSLAFNSTQAAIRDFSSLTITDLVWNDDYTYQLDNTLYNFGKGYRLMKADGDEARANVSTGFVPTLSDESADYGITIYTYDERQQSEISTTITDENAADVLGDGGSVSFVVTHDQQGAPTNILTLNNAVFGGLSVGLECGYPDLTISLRGTSVIRSAESFIVMTANTPSLTFTTSNNTPGSLAFENPFGDSVCDNPEEIDAVLFTGVHPTLEDDLELKQKSKSWVIGARESEYLDTDPDDGLDPIIDNEEPVVVVQIDNTDGQYNYLDGVTIGEVHYTLGADQGYYDDADGTPGVRILVGMDDAEVEAAIADGVPGSDAFDSQFRGVTIKAPAGIGRVLVNVKKEPGAVLRVKVGDNPAYSPEISETSYDPIEITYAEDDDTYIYIYLLDTSPVDPSESRMRVPHLEKVQTISVKITGYSGKSSALFSSEGGNNTAAIYDLSCVGYTSGNTSVTMSSVSTSSSAHARVKHAPMQNTSAISYTITELGKDVFDEITDKSVIRFIDMMGTAVKDLTVNRSAGVFAGFDDDTFIYLPEGEGNESGVEPNVIIGDVCKQLTLDDAMNYQAPASLTFTAQNAQFSRTFIVGKTATVFLPFTIPAAQASALGTFHTFKEISGNSAVFNPAETGDIAANMPYIFVPSENSIAATDVEVKGLGDTTASDGTLYGTYERIEWATDPDDIYGFAANDFTDGSGISQGEFFKVKAGSFILPFRAYIQSSNASSRLQVVILGNDQTGITTVSNHAVDNNVWYSLDGRPFVGKPVKQGIYIHNHKKVIVR
jgi:hypothetical protein